MTPLLFGDSLGRLLRVPTAACLLCVASIASVQRAEPATVQVLTADGESISGTLESLDRTSLVLDDGEPRRLVLADLQRVEFPDRGQPVIRRGSLVLLANGDQLAAAPTAGDDETLTASWVRFPHWKPLDVPLDSIRAVVLRVPEVETARADLLRSVTDPGQSSDLILLENRDRLSGLVAGVTEASVTLETEDGNVAVPRATVRAIAFNPEFSNVPSPSGLSALVRLTDGSVVTVRDLRLEAGGLVKATALFGAELDIPLAAVASMHVLGGRITYLSDLQPTSYDFEPYLDTRRGLSRDRSIDGNPLRLRGIEHRRGLGMHSRSRVTYELGGRFVSFRALAGIDDETRGGGNVVFAVEVDGRQVYASGPVDGRAEPLVIGPIDLTGRDRLTLTVDFGERGDVQDHADWCDAVLVAPSGR